MERLKINEGDEEDCEVSEQLRGVLKRGVVPLGGRCQGPRSQDSEADQEGSQV